MERTYKFMFRVTAANVKSVQSDVKVKLSKLTIKCQS